MGDYIIEKYDNLIKEQTLFSLDECIMSLYDTVRFYLYILLDPFNLYNHIDIDKLHDDICYKESSKIMYELERWYYNICNKYITSYKN